MLSFRSILLAAAAFATFTSAIPAPAPALPIVGDLLSGATGAAQSKRGDVGSAADVFHKCHDDISGIVVKIEAVVKVGGGPERVNKGEVVDLLGEILIIVTGALADLKSCHGNPLWLGGVAITIHELAALVGGIICLLIDVLILVGGILGFTDHLIWDIVVKIGPILCELLTIVIGLVDGLLVLILEILNPYRDHCKQVGLAAIFVALGVRL